MFTIDVLCCCFNRVATEETMLAKTEVLGPVATNPDGIVDSRALFSLSDQVPPKIAGGCLPDKI